MEKFIQAKVVDEDHVYVNGKQFVSLNRFNELRFETCREMNIYTDELLKLTEENNALRVLLRNKLNQESQ